MTTTLAALQSLLQRLAPHILAIVIAWGLAFLPRQMPALMMISAITLLLIARQHITLPSFKQGKAALALLLYAAVSVFWSDSPRALEMLRDISLIAISATILASVSHAWGAAFMRQLMNTLVITFTIALLLFSLNVYLDFPYQRLMNMKIPEGYVGYWESNIPKRSSALFAIYVWPVALYLWQTQRQKIALALLALTAFTLLNTFGRTAMVGSVFGLGVVLVGIWRVRLAQVAGLVFLPLSFLLVLGFGLTVLHSVQPVLKPYISKSGDHRFYIWNFAAHKTIEFMPFGIGMDGSRALPNDPALPAPPYQDGDQLPDHPHNVLLQIWLELGLIGAALASFILWLIWRHFCQQPAAIQPILWGYAVCAITTLAIAYGAWQSWWLGGQALAALLMLRVMEMKNDNHNA